MTEKLRFEVHVERATPACSENCPNLQILSDHEEHLAQAGKMVFRNYKCVNNKYCTNLWRTMRTMTEEKDASK